MPIIVPIEDNKLGLATATDAKFRAPDYSGSGLEALGAGVVQIGAGLEERRRRAAEAIAAAMLDDRHQGNIDDAAVKKAYVAYSDLTHDALHGDDGLFNQQGADAHAAFPGVVEKLVDNHDKSLSTLDDVQRAAVAPAMNQRLRSDVERAADFVRKQGGVEQKWQSKQLQKAAARDAANHADDPDLFDHHMATGENAIRKQAKIDKLSDKVLAKQISDYRSGVTAGAIEALYMRDPAQAAEWFASYGGNLNQRDTRRVAEAMAPMLTEAQAATAGSGGHTVAMNFIPRTAPFDDPQLRDSPAPRKMPWPTERTDALLYHAPDGQGTSAVGDGSMATAGAPKVGHTASAPDMTAANDGEVTVLHPAERHAPFISGEVDGQVVLAAKMKPQDASRLNGRDIIVTPEMRAIAQANIELVRVRAGTAEKTSVVYLMPDGTTQIRPLAGKGTTYGSNSTGDFVSGHTSGPGKPLFIIHGHIEKNTGSSSGPLSGPTGDYGMVDNTDDPNAKGYGDTYSLMTLGIPVATIYNGYIGWHEMRGGQLLFSAPKAAFAHGQVHSLQSNLNSEQKKFLTPKPGHHSKSK